MSKSRDFDPAITTKICDEIVKQFEEKMKDQVSIDLDFANSQLAILDQSYKLIKENGSMYHNNHPNPLGHAVWATYLVRQAGWKDV